MTHRVNRLLEWCDAHAIVLSNIELVDRDIDSSSTDTSGIAVVARGNLAPSKIAATIPKSAVLSKKTSGLLTKIPEIDTSGDDTMELALVLAYEISIGDKSRWFEYLQSLPQEQVPVAALWEGDDDDDSQLAFSWLRGTEAEQVITSLNMNSSVSKHILRCYQLASPALNALGCKLALSSFRRAWSLVSSRAFRVDAYHGLAMVPIADAFNHTGDNQVHIETDFDVCPVCGALQSCSHDDEGSDDSSGAAPLEDTCDMVINSPVTAGDEVFNSYDTNLSNPMLLAYYGFILEGNDHDYVSWRSTALPHSLQSCTTAPCAQLAAVWTASLLADTSLVYNSAESFTHVNSWIQGRGPSTISHYRLNAEGLVSVDLWVLAAVCALRATNASCMGTALHSRLEQLAVIQVYAEHNELRPDHGASTGLVELKFIANLIQGLCRSRLLGLYKPELSVAECGNILDDLPDDMLRTRLAISQALSERVTLSACADAWQELVEYIDEAQTPPMN